jgi:Spy/CpxP family protein refolding chaperone
MKPQIIKTGTTFFLMLMSVFAFAQRPMEGGRDFNREEAKTLKVGIYTRVLELTTKEAEVFWPVYNEQEAKLETIREEQDEIRRELEKNFSEYSDKEIEERVDRMVELRQKEAEIHAEYYEKFKKVLPIKKVALMHRAEMMYKRALLEKMRDRRAPGKR